MDQLDQIIFDQIRQLSLDPDYVPEQPQEEDDREIILSEISRIDKQISRFLDLYGLDQLPMDQLQQKISDLSARKSQLENQLQAPVVKMDKSSAIDLAKGFDDILDHGSFEEIRAVLFTLIDKIYIDGEDIEIHWRF